jgi:hypothetical protein
MKTSALADALTVAFHSLVETLAVDHRRCINSILYSALRDVDLIRDVETRQVIWRLAGLPARHPRDRRPARTAKPSARRRIQTIPRRAA